MSKSDPPTPPDPTATAAGQTSTNVSTAIANAFLNNVNQNTPLGSLRYDQTGNFSWTDPTSGQTYNIPRFTATQTLGQTQQAAQNQTEEAKYYLSVLANNQSQRLYGLLGGNIDLSRAGAAGDPSQIAGVGDATTDFGDAGAIMRNYGASDFSADRSRVEKSLFERMQPQMDRQRNQLEQRLADQGIRYGTPAYSAAMDDYNRSVTDAHLAVTAQGGQEQKLQADMAAQRAGFANDAQQRLFQQLSTRAGFANTARQQQLQRAQAIYDARNQSRSQYLQEQYALRNQPINEISALLSSSQVQQPNFTQTTRNTIPTTDYAGIVNQNFQNQFQNYNTQQQSTDRLLGGLLGFGSNIGTSLIRSDRRSKRAIRRIGTVFAAEPQPVEEPERRKLPVYEYSYKDDPTGVRHVGPMAQDVEKIDPDAVRKDDRGTRYINPRRVMGSILKAA